MVQSSLSLQFESDIPKLCHMDRGRLQQIIACMVSNAIKFSDNKQAIVQVSRQGRSQLKILVSNEGRGVDVNEMYKFCQGPVKDPETGKLKLSLSIFC